MYSVNNIYSTREGMVPDLLHQKYPRVYLIDNNSRSHLSISG